MSIQIIAIIGKNAYTILTLLLNFIQRIHILHGSTHTHARTPTHTHTHTHTHLLENGANVG